MVSDLYYERPASHYLNPDYNLYCILAYSLVSGYGNKHQISGDDQFIQWVFLGSALLFSPWEERVQVMTMIGVATIFECFCSLVWGAYIYRLDNIPLYVPPGHGLFYLMALRLSAVLGTGRLGCWVHPEEIHPEGFPTTKANAYHPPISSRNIVFWGRLLGCLVQEGSNTSPGQWVYYSRWKISTDGDRTVTIDIYSCKRKVVGIPQQIEFKRGII